MKIIYVTRNDTKRVSGGDMVMVDGIKEKIRDHGISIEIVPVKELDDHKNVSAIHLTQLYQLDVAKAAIEWAEAHQIPVYVSPLLEDVLSIWFGLAIFNRTKWYYISKLIGKYLAELLFTNWHMSRRSRSLDWKLQRDLLMRTYVIANSTYEIRHLEKWFRLSDMRSKVIPLGVDADVIGIYQDQTDSYLPTQVESIKGKYILQVGVIGLRKNQYGLLTALRDSNDPIVFLGSYSPYEPEYCSEVKELASRRGNVYFLNRVSQFELISLYRNAACHILPSWSERPGLVTLEAAACGCRVISTDRSPIKEYLAGRAKYCSPVNLSSIRDVVRRCTAEVVPADLSAYVLSKYTWANTAQKLAQIYKNENGNV